MRIRKIHRDFKGISEWEKTASPQEKALKEKAIEFDRLYFDDFNFEPGSITGNAYTAKPCKVDPNVMQNKFFECTPAVIQDFRFRIKEMSGILGNCDKWVITINPSCINRPEILLHEMIHARIQTLPDAFKEIITVCLYEKLKKDVGRKFNLSGLTRFFNSDINNPEDTESLHHGPLFLMKSLDLEIRLGFPCGLVYDGIEWAN